MPDEIAHNGVPTCRQCSREYKREYNRLRARERYATPEGKAKIVAAMKRYRTEKHDRYAAAQRRYRHKLYRNAKRHQQALEDRRIRYRLRREAEGTPVPTISAKAYANGNGAAVPRGTVPAVLLAPLIREWLGEFGGRQLANSDFLRGHTHALATTGAGQRDLAALAGVSDRSLREILTGKRKNVQIVTADRLCAVLDVPLASLYFGESG